VTLDLASDAYWTLAERRIDGERALNSRRCSLRARHDFDQWHEMRRVEWMPDDASFGMAAISLQIAHQKTRRARRDDDRWRQDSIDPVQQLLFERLALGGILLDEFRFGHRLFGLRMKAEAVFRDRLRAAEADKRRPGSDDRPAHEVLSRRRRIAGSNRNPPR